MNITVSPAGRGRYHACLNGRHLCTSVTPFFSAARVLKDEGIPSHERLTMTHEGSDTVCIVSTVGNAARLTVEENATRGPVLRSFSPSPFARPE